jgi:hypothetical protein
MPDAPAKQQSKGAPREAATAPTPSPPEPEAARGDVARSDVARADTPRTEAPRTPAVPYTVPADWAREVQSWLDPADWEPPAWPAPRTRRVGLQRYDTFLLHQARVRYLELEMDFRILFGNWAVSSLGGDPVDVVAGQCARQLLIAARGALLRPEPELPAVTATLDLIERCLIWAAPSYMLGARIPSLQRRLHVELSAETRDGLEPLLRRLELAGERAPGDTRAPLALHEVRSAIEEAIVALNTATTERHIASGLQLERLSLLRDRGLMLLGVLLLMLPMLLPPIAAGAPAAERLTAPFVLRFVPLAASDAWLSGLTVALFGAAGGFLSGLLQARASRVTTAEYQDSLLRLELRPIVGATIATVLYVLLSWRVLPGVAITLGGSYLLLAFLSGFSERYFLRLLELDRADAQEAAVEAVARAEALRPANGVGGNGHGAPSANGNGGRIAGLPIVGAIYRGGARAGGYDENAH